MKKMFILYPIFFYGIIDNTCYIYAIQNDFNKKTIPEIEKLIYKLYSGKGQPNMVYTMKLFVSVLKEKGIKKIKIPILQVLSYDYHKLLSEKEKVKFPGKWDKITFDYIATLNDDRLKYKLKEYEHDKTWYEHIVDKEDIISKNKTENLINLMYRVIEEDEELLLMNDIDIGDMLDIKINSKVKNNCIFF